MSIGTHSLLYSFLLPVDHRCAAYISALYHHDILLYVLRQSCNADDGKKSIISGKKTFLILMMRLRKWMIMSAGSYGSFFLVSTKKAWHRNDLMLREMLFVQASSSCNVCLTRSKSGSQSSGRISVSSCGSRSHQRNRSCSFSSSSKRSVLFFAGLPP